MLLKAFDRLRQKVSIVIVDHHPDLAPALSDGTVVLERSTVQWSGEARTLREDEGSRRSVLWL